MSTQDSFTNTPIRWHNASPSDIALLENIKKLLGAHMSLLSFIFHHKYPRLRLPANVIKQQSMQLSSGEIVLIKLALDL